MLNLEITETPRNLLLRQKRRELKMSREQLAEAVKLHPSYIQHIENGSRVPAEKTLLRLAEALQIPKEVFDRAAPARHIRQRARRKNALAQGGESSPPRQLAGLRMNDYDHSRMIIGDDPEDRSTPAPTDPVSDGKRLDEALKALDAFTLAAKQLDLDGRQLLLQLAAHRLGTSD